MSDVATSGGCHCGAVRFRAEVVGTSVTWTRGQPAHFRSSNVMQRGFCSSCGTPLCCIDADGMVEMAGGAFDDPAVAAPAEQYNLKYKVPFFDTLPAIRHQPRA